MSDILVVKRDGTLEEYDIKKIAKGIMGAATEVGGEDYELADEIADCVTDIIETNNYDQIASEELQKIVEKVLIEGGHAATAKEYILMGADRSRMREMSSSLMHSFEEITFKAPEESEIQRENANIDSSTAMGTMLKYGSEGAKKFNMLYLMSRDIANAHINGDIHIHDLDFLALTETCIPSIASVTLRINGRIRHVNAKFFLECFGLSNVNADTVLNVEDRNIEVLSNGKFVKVTHAVKHKAAGKTLKCLITPSGPLFVTSEHRVSTYDSQTNSRKDVRAEDINIGDTLCIPEYTGVRTGETYFIKLTDLMSSEQKSKSTVHNTKTVVHRLKNSTGNASVEAEFNPKRLSLYKKGLAHMSVAELCEVENELSAGTKTVISIGKVLIENEILLDYNTGRFIGLLACAEVLCSNLMFKNAKSAEKCVRLSRFLINKGAMHVDKNNKKLVRCADGIIKLRSILALGNAAITTKFPNYMYEASRDFRAGIISACMDAFGGLGEYMENGISGMRSFWFHVNNAELESKIKAYLRFNGIASVSYTSVGIQEGTGIEIYNSEDLNWVRLQYKGGLSDPIKCVGSIDRSVADIQQKLTDIKNKGLTVIDIINLKGTELGWVVDVDNPHQTGFEDVIGWNISDYIFCSSDSLFDGAQTFEEHTGDEYVYDITTEDGHFDVDGFCVHNCCQIPLDKLFHDGFNTGHGFLREPGGIRTAGALAAIAIQSNQNDQHGGQSIPMFDYYLAPYVSLSFVKNIAKASKIKLGLTEEQTKEVKNCLIYYRSKIDDKRIMDSRDNIHKIEIAEVLTEVLKHVGVTIGKKRLKQLLIDAYDETYDETFQSMEAFIHNLNTMHCLPASERIWVYDNECEQFRGITMEELDNTFELGRYQVISLNTRSGAVSLKAVTASKRKDNNRNIITLVDESGRKVRVTDNHRVMTIRNSDTGAEKISEDIPANIDNVIVTTDNLNESQVTHNVILDSLLLGNKLNDKVRKTRFSGIGTSKIVSKEKSNSGDEYVYDISVEENENFMTYEGIFVHNSRAGAQVPFSSINYGTDTSEEGRMVMKCILETTWNGLGNGETAIFPIQILKIKAGVNYNPEDKNYDIFKLSCKVSAKQLFPNFENLDAPYNAELYIEGRPETEMATMGCAEGNETVNILFNSNKRTVSLKELWSIGLNELGKLAIKESGNTEYIEVGDIDLRVLDSYTGSYVKVWTLIRNKNVDNWSQIILNGGQKLTLTLDHPLHVDGRGRRTVDKLMVGNKLCHRQLGLLEVCLITKDVQFTNDQSSEYSYDIETESDRFDLSGIYSHNCRTRVGKNVHDQYRSIIPGRGNLSFTSINLPRLGILAHGDIDKFYDLLNDRLELVHRQLLERFEIQCQKHPRNYPFLMGQGCWLGSDQLGPDDDIRDILKHGTLTVGFIGLAETLVALIGKHHGESDEAQQLGLEIIGHIRKFTDKWSEEEKMNYSVIGTPAEGLSGRFTAIDKQIYGEIPGVTDRDYYTNSSHVPVYYPISATKKVDIEAPYHALENGGHILYIEIDGDPLKNLRAFENIVRYMHDKNAGYFSINHAVDSDIVCGYQGIIDDVCPRCGRREGEPMTMEMWRKVKGYANVGNAATLGYAGNPDEERDRIPNVIDEILKNRK